MTMGRCGKKYWSRTAKNGCAAWLTPAQINTPPCSSRCARRCTAGAFNMSANKSLAADAAAFCAKPRHIRSGERNRQAGGDRGQNCHNPFNLAQRCFLGRGGHDYFKGHSRRFCVDKLPNRSRESPCHSAPPFADPRHTPCWSAIGCRPVRRGYSWSDRHSTS